MGERRVVEVVYGGDNSTNLENTNLDQRAIHIDEGIEHNLAKYAKYYPCGRIDISWSSEFTRETDHNIRDFSRHW